MTIRQAVDVVYTWVDDSWPGYQQELCRYAGRPADLDKGRTRYSVDTLRFSLRSLVPLLGELGTIYIVTCRPQVPDWLNTGHPRIRVVHHDSIMPADMLPTFNSLAILSQLHQIERLSPKFLYLEDDILLGPGFGLADMINAQEKYRLYPWRYPLPDVEDLPRNATPWKRALARTKQALTEKFGPATRQELCHGPIWIDRDQWTETLRDFAKDIERTRLSRFRAEDNIDPVTLYAWGLASQGKAVVEPRSYAARVSGYTPLERFWPLTLWLAWHARRRGAKWFNFNDNMGQTRSTITEWLVTWLLQRWYPDPSPFENRA